MQVGDRWYRAAWWEDDTVRYIDQRRLPHRFSVESATSVTEAARAIKDMGVRGAPTIGVMGAYALALAARNREDPEAAYGRLLGARPTAVNLRFGLDAVAPACRSSSAALEAAKAYDDAEVAAAEAIGEHGLDLVRAGTRVATHCNAGWLAAQDWGTALSPIYKAALDARSPVVIVDETRPRMQGARITAWELGQAGVRHVIISDGAAASMMRMGEIDLVITGADRIAANGDVANKIGTYPLALAAKANGVPFYVAAPLSTIDPGTLTGDAIPIEERAEDEVLAAEGLTESGEIVRVQLAPEGSSAANPAFDVTSAELVTGIITERGVIDASKAGIREAIASRAH